MVAPLTTTAATPVGRELDARRQRLGLTTAALARRAKLGRQIVVRLLAGQTQSPEVATLQALAGALGVEVVLRPGSLDVVEVLPADEFREHAARLKAERIVRMVQGTSALEGQGLGPADRGAMVRRTFYELMAKPGALWG
jgi:transcriptional regulator with XRE-family HTH domain